MFSRYIISTKLCTPLMSFAEIPQIYPSIISSENFKLIPLAERSFMFFASEIGHDKPKHTNIMVSKTSGIVKLLDDLDYIDFFDLGIILYSYQNYNRSLSMELTQLKHFVKVAELEHLTHAANILNIAQPALTQTIKKLEEELGVRLFRQDGRGVKLSAAGKFFYKSVCPLLDELDELPKKLKQYSIEEDKTVCLNVLAASALVTQAIIEYKKIDESLLVKLTQNEESENYDICVTTAQSSRKSKSKDSGFICSEKIFLAVPNTSEYEAKARIKLSEIEQKQVISLSGAKQFRGICDKFCRAKGAKLHIAFESDSAEAVKNMIGAGLGVGFWPEFSWGRIAGEKIKMLEIADGVFSRDIFIKYRETKSDNSTIRRFYEFLKNYMEALENEQKIFEKRDYCASACSFCGSCC